MAALTRRRTRMLSDKTILDSLVNQIWNGVKRISWHSFITTSFGSDRIGQASAVDSTPLLVLCITAARLSNWRRGLHRPSRRFLTVALSQKALPYAPGIDEIANDLAAFIDPRG